MQRGPPTPSAAKPEDLFLLIIGAALVTAPLCKLLRKLGERARERFCDDDDEVEHADEEAGGEDEGEDEGEERDVDDASSV
tara:strand:- start:666 stop:908 length:243 start_codon:yes stop_codon:yes gene_type:complete